MVPPPNTNAPEPGAPELDENARPLSLPPLSLIASLRVRQDVENGDADAHPSLPLQRRVTKHIIREWDRHKIALSNPPIRLYNMWESIWAVCEFITAVPITKLFARAYVCVFITAVPITKLFVCRGRWIDLKKVLFKGDWSQSR